MSKNEKKVEEQVMPESETTETQQNPELTIQDLNNLKEIIDVASTRGAFRPKEMMAVGHVYAKLENFLEAVAKTPKEGE